MTHCPLLTVNTCILEQAHQTVSITPPLLWGIAIEEAVKSTLAGVSAVKLWPPGQQTSRQAGRRRGGALFSHITQGQRRNPPLQFDQITQIRILYNAPLLGCGQGHAAPGKPIMEFSFFFSWRIFLSWRRRSVGADESLRCQCCFLPITVQIKDHHGPEPVTAESPSPVLTVSISTYKFTKLALMLLEHRALRRKSSFCLLSADCFLYEAGERSAFFLRQEII